jgi:hypothetical protein
MSLNRNKKIALALLIGACGLSATAQTKEYSWSNLPKISQPVFKKGYRSIFLNTAPRPMALP